MIRRLKRLPIMALALAKAACDPIAQVDRPSAVCLGTGWGALSETHDFLQRLFETRQAFPSPMDFIGSVHNAPAGQIAMLLGTRGANVTVSGGDYSFEQALLAASLTAGHNGDTILVVGADEHHPALSPVFDPCVGLAPLPSDGGGAVVLHSGTQGEGPSLVFIDYRSHQSEQPDQAVTALLDQLGGASHLDKRFGAVMAGIPAAYVRQAGAQLRAFLQHSGFKGPVVDYRRWTGQFASASAVAVVLSIEMVKRGVVPGALCDREDALLEGKGILVLGLGPHLTALGVYS
jgi:3-oxoacyl-[acyl-carrier-protein] synthase-1/3-oxoacyl-[acyl-carrier-protein] synthase II